MECWNDKFNSFILSFGFIRSRHDYYLYVKTSDTSEDVVYLILYVGDLLIVRSKEESINKLKAQLKQHFEMSDCGPLKYFLGIKLTYDNGNLTITQENSIKKVLEKFGLKECNHVQKLMEKGLQLEPNKFSDNTKQPYRELLVSLMYIMLFSRPDICYQVGYLGRYQQNPSDVHWQHLKRIARYLKGTMFLKFSFNQTNSEPIVGYADADWAFDLTDRKSVSGYVFKVYGCTVSWSSKKQQTVRNRHPKRNM